jgi:NADH:ubiquinone oxidoreductase subunit 3 (subunit A)
LIGREDTTAMRAVAITALIKPQGWLFAAVALIVARAPVKVWLAAIGAIGILVVRDALLWKSAFIAPANTEYGGTYGSSIIAHGAPALALLAAVALRSSPFALFAIGAALLGPLALRRHPRLGWGAFIAALVFLVLPFGYASSVAQLATGASLRFAAPAIAAGALLMTRIACRRPALAAILFAASALFGACSILAVFWNDAPARAAPIVALLAVGALAVVRGTRRPWPVAAGFAIAAIAASLLAASHPADFYADALRVDARSTGLYAWLGKSRPPAIGGWGLALGAVNVLAPRTRTVELIDADACESARRNGLLLVAVAENDRTAQSNASRLRAARACGAVFYDDGLAVAVAPASLPHE